MSASRWYRCWLSEIALAPQGVLRLRNALRSIALGISGAIAVSGSPGLAQITPDPTLGTERSIVKPNVNVQGLPADRIDGGALRGSNLFHSFSQFNVTEGSRVYFANPAGIENILTRVTGNNLSNILGTLGVDGGASLFLLNPNGIIFGANAKLDIAGSFVASTANGVVFDNGFAFSTTNPQAPPLLTVKVPLGLQYGSSHLGATIANSGNLAVGQNLGLAADNLDLQGELQAGGHLVLLASNTLRVRDSTTHPFAASAEGHLVVQGNQRVDIFALNHPNSGFFSGGDMVLRSANSVVGDARYWSGGSFRIQGLDGKPGDLSSLNDPIIRSVGDVSFTNYVGTSLHILAGGSVTIPGIVAITSPETGIPGVDYIAENVTLSDGRVILIDGRARPTFDVRAGVNPADVGIPGITGKNITDVFFSGFINLFGLILPIPENPGLSNTPTSADIKIGGIAMLGRNAADGLVLLTNQYKPNRSLPGGNIEVSAIVTTDNISQALNQLPADLRNLLASTGLLDGFTGNGGDVIIDSRSKIALNESGLANFGLNFGLINTSSGTGNAGDITLLAQDTVSLTNSFILSDSSGVGRGGDITVKAPSVSFTDGTVVSASTYGTGLGGNLTVLAPESVQVANSQLFAGTTGDGNAGDLTITTGRLTVRDRAAVATLTFGNGNAGTLRINTGQFIVRDGLVATSTLGDPDLGVPPGKGRGGDLIVKASDSVELSSTVANGTIAIDIPIPGFNLPPIEAPIGLFTTSQSLGDAGNLTIETGRLTIRDGAVVSTSTSGEAEGGNLTVNASSLVELIGISGDWNIPSALFSETYGSGKGGDMTITTPQLFIRDGAVVSTATGILARSTPEAKGQGGNLTVTANLIELSGTSANPILRSAFQVSTAGFGDAGNLRIDTSKLIVRDGAVILAASLRDGNSGSITVNADSIEVLGTAPDNLPSGLSTGTVGKGVGGNLTINTRILTVRDGALISAATVGPGTGGNLTVNASEWVELAGRAKDGRPSGLSAGSGIAGVSSIPLLRRFGVDPSKATGPGGDLSITTGRLLVRDGAEVSTATLGPGIGGNIQVDANSLALTNGAQLSAATSGSGRAGNITLRVRDDVTLAGAGTGVFANTALGSTGNGGSIFLNPRTLLVRDGAGIAVGSQGTGTGGNIEIHSNTISLDHQGFISAKTASNTGGNITLQVQDLLLMRHGSEISTSAGTERAGGDGGNINIDAEFIVGIPSENSDITANAFQGRGGNINITTQRIFGLEYRPRLTPQSDITASSEFGVNGTVQINTPGIDPNRGLAQLPANVVDATGLIDRRCAVAGGTAQTSRFTVTGRGGLPPNPNETLNEEGLLEDLGTSAMARDRATTGVQTAAVASASSSPNRLVEAQGWIIGADGKVILTAQAPTATPQHPWQTPASCRSVSNSPEIFTLSPG